LVATSLPVLVGLNEPHAALAQAKETAIGSGGVIVILAETEMLLSDAEVAVTVTVVPEGTAGGAV
jgi:hypothetical protein